MRTRSNRRVLGVCTGLALIVAAGLWVGTMMAVGPENPAQSRLVELGNGVDPLTPGLANILGDVLQPGADWGDLFAADRSFKDVFDEFGNPGANGVPDFLDTYGTFRARRDAVFVLDDLSADGSDVSARLGTGLVGAGPVFPEHDLGNVYAYAAFDSNRDLIVYTGVERLTATGSSDVTLEFNQSSFSVDAGGAIQGSRTIGDLQIHAIFTSGALSSVEIRTWDLDPADSTHKFFFRDILSSPAPEQCNAAGTACAVCNSFPVSAAAWPSFNAAGAPVANLTQDTFLEVGVNLGRLLGSDTYDMRFRSVQATTPEDYAVGSFERASFQPESVLNGCMQDVAGFNLNCTANDIQIASVFDVMILDDGCTSPNDTVEIAFTGEVFMTAQQRHDIGIYFATDGGDALTGSCFIDTLPFDGPFDESAFCLGPADPFPCCTAAGTGCTGTYADLDDACPTSGPNPFVCAEDLITPCATDADCLGVDTCGDIDNTEFNPLFQDFGPIVFQCQDTDGDGFLDVAVCTSWRQPGGNELCLSPLDAFPGAPSKCRCDTALSIPVPIPGFIVVDKVTLDPLGNPSPGDPTLFDFSITNASGADPDLPDNFSLADADPPHNSPGLDTPESYTVTETVPGGWDLVSANCVSSNGDPDQDPTLVNIDVGLGEVVTCTYTNQLIDPCFGVDCSQLDDQCNDGVCEDQGGVGVCVAVPKPDSTPCEDGDSCTSETGTPQTPDHCFAGVCTGVPVDCSPLDDQCNDGVCNPATGACEAIPKADSTPCEDGDFCTSETGTPQTPDHCFAGVCTGVPVDCSPLDDQCNDGVCNPATGACEAIPKADSTPCEDGDSCTSETGTPQTPDHCFAGVCTGVPVDCSPLDDQCNDGVCNPATGACEAIPKADSTPCEDGDSCTSETGTPQTPDHCFAGVCTGVPVDCSPLDDQCNDGVCNPATGACEAIPKADSTPCEDGDSCTSETGTPQTPDHCEMGICVGIPVDCSPLDDQCNDGVCNPATGACEAIPKADSTPCEDGDSCTSETGTPQTPDHCEMGICVGIPVDCSPLDDQCNDGVCNPATGACEAIPKADSTPCEDGDACTSETGTPQTPDHCEMGICVGIPVDCSPLDDQCNDGVCNPATGACEAIPKADSTPCEDGDSCTSETGTPQTPDHCEMGICVGIPVDCSPLDDQCNDGVCNPATGACEAIPKADSTPCEDGDSCTSETGTPQTPDHCEMGICVGIPVDCSPLDDQCNDGVCNPATGACEAIPKADSTPCEDGDSCTSETGTPQTPDHCEMGICVGIPVDCSPLDDQCNDGVCNPATGACEAIPKADSTPCEDGDSCTSETGTPQTPDHCEMGICVGIPVDCSPLDDQCNDGVCNPATGACEAIPKADSTPCEDGDSCTSETGTPQTPDHCEMGICVGIPVDCSPLDDQCNDGVCNPATGACEAIPKADSTPCEDGDACTSETGTPQTPDHCEMGICVGIPVDCSPLDDQCNDGVCNPATGACEAIPKADSTPCEDGDFCTSELGVPQTPDHCEMGICVGIPVDCSPLDDQCNDGVCNPNTGACEAIPKADSTPCEDGDFCTSELGVPQTPDHCEMGICVGIPVDCSPLDDQCNDGVCNDVTGLCEAIPKADSTPCEDGDICTSETGIPQTPDHCFGGVCTGIPIDCGPGDQCNDFVCNSDTGTCEAIPKADSTPCEDGDFCTSETGTPQTPDHCEMGVCVGVPVDCSATPGGGGICGEDPFCNPDNAGACEVDSFDTCSRTQGYWHRQCMGAGLILRGRDGRGGPDHVLEPKFDDILADVQDYYDTQLGGDEGLACEDGMVTEPASDPCEKALKQLTALLFNSFSGRVQDSTPIDVSAEGCSATNIGDLIVELTGLWNDPDRTENDCKDIQACAEAVNDGLSNESLAIGSTTTEDTQDPSSDLLMTPVISGRTSSPAVESVESQEVSTTAEPTTSPVGVVGIPVADEAVPEIETDSEADSAPVDEDPQVAIKRHLATLGNATFSEEDRLVSQDALLTALSGGYEPGVRLEIVRGLLGNVDPMVHSLLARHLENIRDEARDFDKEALAEAAERLLRSLEPEATIEE